MGSRLSRILIPLVLFVLVLSFAKISYSLVNSLSSIFSVFGYENYASNTTYLNWTNNFNNMMNVSTNSSFNNSLFVNISNATSGLTENYTQGNTQTACQSGNLKLIVYNSTGNSNNTILVNGTFNLSFSTANCLPGRYITNNFTIFNSSKQNESANVSVVLDLPINNTDQTSGIGYFTGTIPINYTTYQSYYFNTSIVPNATSVLINLSGWTSSKDVDAFLFDNSSTPVMKVRGTNKTSTSESLIFYYLPRDNFWEIRVFGNSTSSITYNGNITYSALNATTPNGPTISQLNYSALLANATNNTNITLRNEGNISLTSVAQTLELYNARRYSGSGAANYSFMMPNSSLITRIKAKLSWNGQSNYTLNVYNATNDLVLSAFNQYLQANISGAQSEVYNETTSTPASAGIWTFEVKNNTNVAADSYTLSVLMYVNAANWLATNYSTFTFNRTGNNNYTTDVSINLTIPNNSIDGIYEGNISYLAANGAGISVPVWINVTAPSLIFAGTTSSYLYRIDENIGANLTRSFNFLLNNTGSYNLTINMTNSSVLSSTATSYQPNLTLNTTTELPAGSGRVINVNVTFNSSMPVATYDGWIYINGTNNSVPFSGHPADSINVTIRLNLTTILVVNVSGVTTANGNNVVFNTSQNDNVTTKLNITYLNGTPVETQLNLNATNISVWLIEGNVSTRVPSTGNFSMSNGTNPLYCTSGCPSGTNFYYPNSSVTSSQIGGAYDVHVGVNLRSGPNVFYGEGINRSLIINNTGLYMTAMNSTSLSLTNSSTYVFAVNVTNYGGLAGQSGTTTISFSESCGYTVSSPTYVNCPSTTPFIPSPFNSSCVVKWTITANTTAESACTGNIVGAPASHWHNPNGVNVSVTTTVSGSSSNATSTSAAAAATTTTTANSTLTFSLADTTIYVEQNKTNTSVVQVKNSGSTTQTVNFSIDTINSSWYTINYTGSTSLTTGKVVGFLVTLNPGNAEFKDYSGNFKATGSLSSATSAFTLKVLPSTEKRTEISSIFDQLNSNFTSLSAEINKTKNEGKNTTEAQQKYDMYKAKLDQANTYLKNGDFTSAYQLINEIKSLYSQTKDALSKATASPFGGIGNFLSAQWGYLTYILIGGGVAAGAFIAYLFWPTKGAAPGYVVGPAKPVIATPPKVSISERLGFLKKIKELFAKIFSRFNRPKQAYQYKV